MAVVAPSEGPYNMAEGNNMSMDRNRNMGADMGAVDSNVASKSIAERARTAVGSSIAEGTITAGSPSTAGRQQP